MPPRSSFELNKARASSFPASPARAQLTFLNTRCRTCDRPHPTAPVIIPRRVFNMSTLGAGARCLARTIPRPATSSSHSLSTRRILARCVSGGTSRPNRGLCAAQSDRHARSPATAPKLSARLPARRHFSASSHPRHGHIDIPKPGEE